MVRNLQRMRAIGTLFLVSIFFTSSMPVMGQFGPSMPSMPSPGGGGGGFRSPSPSPSYRPSPSRYTPSTPRYPSTPHPSNRYTSPSRGGMPGHSGYNHSGNPGISPRPQYHNPYGYTPPGGSHSPSTGFSITPPRVNVPTPGHSNAPRIYGTRSISTQQQWKNINTEIRNKTTSQIKSIVDRRLESSKSLGGLMSAVTALERANAPTDAINKYRTQAMSMARTQVSQNVNTPDPYIAVAKFSLEGQNEAEFRRVTQTMEQRFPDHQHTHYFKGMRAIKDQDWKTAEIELKKAKAKGLPDEALSDWLKMVIDRQKIIWDFAYYTVYAILGWLLGLLVLYLVGKAFSKSTLKSLRMRHPTDISGGQRMLRRMYGVVVALAGLYYYISMPMLLITSIALPLSLAYALLMLPVMNFFLIFIVLTLGVGGIVTALTAIITCFMSTKRKLEGKSLTRHEHPDLWAFVDDIAREVGTRTVDEILLMPTDELFVFEKGSTLRKMLGRGRRVLVIGTAVLEDLTQQCLRSILAHELGHFSHGDTAGGNIAVDVFDAMSNFAEALSNRKKIRKWDLAIHFLRLYHFLLRRLMAGARRLQEIHADIVAARCYGVKAFQQGLVHAIRRSLEFHRRVGNTIEANVAGRPTAVTKQFYRASSGLKVDDREDIEVISALQIHLPSDEESTHPSPLERFRLIERLDLPQSINRASTDRLPAWNLFSNSERLEEEMSDVLSELMKLETQNTKMFSEQLLNFMNEVLATQNIPEAYEERARNYFTLGKYNEAIEDLNRAIKLARMAPHLYYYRAIVYRDMGELDKAIEDLERLVSRISGGQVPDSYHLLGTCYLRQKRYKEAADAFSKTIDLDERSLGAWIGMARSLVHLKNYKDAEDAFRLLTESFPLSVEIHTERGMLHSRQKRYAHAAADFDRAIEIEPSYAQARIRRAWLLSTCPDDAYRNGERAIADLEHIRKKYGSSALFHNLMAAAQAEAGNFDEAVACAQMAIDMSGEAEKKIFQARQDLYRKRRALRIEAA